MVRFWVFHLRTFIPNVFANLVRKGLCPWVGIFNLEKSCLNFVKFLFESIFFMKSVGFVNCKSLFQIFCKSYSQEFVSLSCFISNASIIQLRIFFFSMIYHLHINLKKYYTLLYLGKLKNNIKKAVYWKIHRICIN